MARATQKKIEENGMDSMGNIKLQNLYEYVTEEDKDGRLKGRLKKTENQLKNTAKMYSS